VWRLEGPRGDCLDNYTEKRGPKKMRKGGKGRKEKISMIVRNLYSTCDHFNFNPLLKFTTPKENHFFKLSTLSLFSEESSQSSHLPCHRQVILGSHLILEHF